MYPCPECKKVLKQISHLKKHVLVHSGQRPFPCNQCEKSFNQKGNLYTDIKTHLNVEDLSCNHCDLSFKERTLWCFIRNVILEESKEYHVISVQNRIRVKEISKYTKEFTQANCPFLASSVKKHLHKREIWIHMKNYTTVPTKHLLVISVESVLQQRRRFKNTQELIAKRGPSPVKSVKRHSQRKAILITTLKSILTWNLFLVHSVANCSDISIVSDLIWYLIKEPDNLLAINAKRNTMILQIWGDISWVTVEMLFLAHFVRNPSLGLISWRLTK